MFWCCCSCICYWLLFSCLRKLSKSGEREMGTIQESLFISTKRRLIFPRLKLWWGVGSSVQAVGGYRGVERKWESVSPSIVPAPLWPHGLQPAWLLWPWDFPGKDTGIGCYFLLQRIFPTQGSNPGLLHCRQILSDCATRGGYRGVFSIKIIWIKIIDSNWGPKNFILIHRAPELNGFSLLN